MQVTSIQPVRLAVVGYGYWGPNLARNIDACDGATLAAVCDAHEPRRAAAAQLYPAATMVERYDAVLDDPDIDGVVLATPAAGHHQLGREALDAGKHVLVEKPLAMNTRDGIDLVRAAEARGLVLMAGHTFLYEAAVEWLRDSIARGDLGDIAYLYAQRLNLGRIRSDVNALWNLAPHDVSIALHVLDDRAVAVTARGVDALQPGIEDAVFLDIEFASGALAHVHVSWLDPQKVRRMVVLGTRRMVVYDDVSRDQAITVHDRGFDPLPGEGGFQMRDGGAHVVDLERPEPLALECADFVDSIRTGREPRTSGRRALEVVRVLEAAQTSLATGSNRVALGDDAPA
jgi:predicted dehydrogenase